MKFKKILHAGKGDQLDFPDGAKAIFDYQARLLCVTKDGIEEGEVIDDTRKKWPHGYGQPLELVFGKKFQISAWEDCLKTMKIDEVARFDIDPPDLTSYPSISKKLRDIGKGKEAGGHNHEEHHHHSCFGMTAQFGLGYKELDDYNLNPCPLRFTFHLHKLLLPDDYQFDAWQMDPDQKLNSVTELKAKGNRLFQENKLPEAADCYKEALKRLDDLQVREKPGEPEYIDLDNQKLSFYLNLAQVWLKTGDFYKAIEACDEALKRDPKSEKGLFRRSKAYVQVWDLERARADLKLLSELYPKLSESLVRKELLHIEQLEKTKTNEEKSIYKAMISS